MWASLLSRLPPAGLRRAVRLRQSERPTTLWLPQFSHLARSREYMIRHVDGAVFAMFAVNGVPYEDADAEGTRRVARAAVRAVPLALHAQQADHRHISGADRGGGRGPAALSWRRRPRPPIDAGYRRRLIGEGRLWHNELFLGAWSVRQTVRKPGAWRTLADIAAEDVRDLETTLGTIEADLGADYGLRRLGLRAEGRLLYSEMAETLALVLTGRRRKVPLVAGAWAAPSARIAQYFA